MTTSLTAPLTPEGSKYRLPSQPGVVEITPEMASDWLSYRNHPKNRTMSKSITSKYQKDMESGRWPLTPEGLFFDTEGYIISGQHRLKALANTTLTLPFWVFPNESRDIFDVVDQGYKRSAGQILGVPNATTVGGAARYLAVLPDRDRWSMPRFNRVTIPEIVGTVRAWPEVTRYSTDVMNVRQRTYITAAPHLAVLAQAARTEHADKIPEWIRGLTSGANLADTDARVHLRNRFLVAHAQLGGTKNRDLVYSLVAKAWNAYALGKPVIVLVHRSTEPLARVAGSPIDAQEAEAA